MNIEQSTNFFIKKKTYRQVDHNKIITDNLRLMISNIFDLYSWRIVIVLLPLSFYGFIFLLFGSKSTINVITHYSIQYSLLFSIYQYSVSLCFSVLKTFFHSLFCYSVRFWFCWSSGFLILKNYCWRLRYEYIYSNRLPTFVVSGRSKFSRLNLR